MADTDELPDDIRAAAIAVVDRAYDVGLIDAVSKALLAERLAMLQWCVSVCDHALEHYKGPVAMKIRRELAVKAAAIRKSQP